jgi:glycolate oxidase FAD binding subunit
VITARGGTPLAEIEEALREKGQMLPSSRRILAPERRWADAWQRDCPGPGALMPAPCGISCSVVRVLDGKGEDLHFGGQVMKNVAATTVSRLMAGSLGTLGVLDRGLAQGAARPPAETTLRLSCGDAEALESMNRWAGSHGRFPATAFPRWRTARGDSRERAGRRGRHRENRGMRVSVGVAAGAAASGRECGVRPIRISPVGRRCGGCRCSPRTPSLCPGEGLIEWGGALRWLKTSADRGAVRDAAKAAGGHATLFRGATSRWACSTRSRRHDGRPPAPQARFRSGWYSSTPAGSMPTIGVTRSSLLVEYGEERERTAITGTSDE